MSNTLTPEIIQERIKKIPEWELNEDSISRSFEFDEYQFAIDFVNTIAEIAEEAQHHPDISINYTNVTLVLTTHSKGGLTDSDFEVALRIDSLRD
ncbi:MAG: 4a-hydroxytetrahydrobiopterin dehydratase [Verrucomicrobiota bacterium]|nr:4a-hydroxytetrahydrobiopterin dehydratase [Verrucomicrobiota bacterium]MEC8906650.1 4a-hydroxytetrahydrobiopterin dehydratase [Verrucomicrobiota bacterium]MEC9327459.1 4a-hydroxytetrahydrobiopterin dehydratase [Verrucomicrobiota bacterium]MEE2966821.1 4a-hydroxytetrahydrobiopterin dehydratase [Verrucomicrobiota bacterium]